MVDGQQWSSAGSDRTPRSEASATEQVNKIKGLDFHAVKLPGLTAEG
jgi:hypothetical protein